MLDTKSILLASHGTRGAQAALQTSLVLCSPGGEIHHLVVVPEFWKGMTGDDWLNNGITRDRFRRYLETEIGRETSEHCDAVEQACKTNNIHYQHAIMLGKPDQCLLDYSTTRPFGLVIMGSPRPKGEPGLRSRMNTETLAKKLSIPLLIVPFPDD